jgi:hypothetical protein
LYSRLSRLFAAHLSLERGFHDPRPIQVLKARGHLYYATDRVVRMRWQLATRLSCTFGIRECHKSCGYRGIVLNGTGAILGDEGSQKIELCSEVVNLGRGVSTEE